MAKPAAITKAAEDGQEHADETGWRRAITATRRTQTQASSSNSDSEDNRKDQSVSQSFIHCLTEELSGS